MSGQPALTDITTLRERARRHMERGAVTEGYSADREQVIRILNEALATEIGCVLRYKSRYFRADGNNANVAAEEFEEHADDMAGLLADVDRARSDRRLADCACYPVSPVNHWET